MTTTIIAVCVYALGLPLLTILYGILHKKLVTQKRQEKALKKKSDKPVPPALMSVWGERLPYALAKDTRPTKTAETKRQAWLEKQKKEAKKAEKAGTEVEEVEEPQFEDSKLSIVKMCWTLWGIGLAIVVVGSFMKSAPVILIGMLAYFVFFGYAVKASKSLLEARKNMMLIMREIGELKLNYAKGGNEKVVVLEWSDPLTPKKIKYDLPTNFSQSGEEGFLKHFNQIFGVETSWVAWNDPDSGKPGWDYNYDGTSGVTLAAVPPLPRKAPFDAHYVVNEQVAWSFFPIALGVENGLELPGEDGKMENVLGFDVSGEQEKVSKQFGLKQGREITTSPMIFVGGGTGGGKAISINEKVVVVGNIYDRQGLARPSVESVSHDTSAPATASVPYSVSASVSNNVSDSETGDETKMEADQP